LASNCLSDRDLTVHSLPSSPLLPLINRYIFIRTQTDSRKSPSVMGDAARNPVKPVILLLHGAWHLPKHYERLISALRTEAGYQVYCPEIPSCNDAFPPNKTLDDDVRYARSAAMDIMQTGRDLAVLMHSYGGVVGTNALAGLHQAREVDGRRSGRVVSLIYMTAFVPFEDESLAAMFGGQLPPWLTSNPETKNIDIDDPQHHFYSDLDKTEQDKWAAALVRHPVCCQYKNLQDAVLKQELGPRVAWRDVEKVVYLVAAEDQGLPEFVQRMMIDKLEKEGGLGSGAIQVETLRSSHSPFLSMPGKVVELVKKHV
jgi:pimeloyl-ACP methyl ester carboxylesterase